MKTGSIPYKADPVAQKEFLENTLEPLISAAKRKEVELYFVDAAHFVMGAFLGYLWSKFRVFIRTPSGRNDLKFMRTFIQADEYFMFHTIDPSKQRVIDDSLVSNHGG